jgi:polysaccharide export outer membrane protein
MEKTILKYLSLFSAAILLNSCASPEKIVYFQDSEGQVINDTLINFEPEIQFGDILAINVSAIEAEAAIPFNLYETPNISERFSNPKPLTYLVNIDGDIQFPVIGTLKVGGLTTKQIVDKLTKVLVDYIKNPIINIRLVNFKVSVLGEVKNPGTYIVENERISIIEAIGLAGDLTIHGKRKSVMLIREIEGKRTFVTIDLTQKALFNSPHYYLSQNDVVYVAPNKTKINASAVGTNTGVLVSSASILIALIALIIR